jgi:hypothetical protein
MTQRNYTPGFDNINDFITARDARSDWFGKIAKAAWRKLTESDEEKPNPIVMRGLHIS